MNETDEWRSSTEECWCRECGEVVCHARMDNQDLHTIGIRPCLNCRGHREPVDDMPDADHETTDEATERYDKWLRHIYAHNGPYQIKNPYRG